MNYRREIDGLRAVAVLPVILFHAGFAPFAGGYVGVDIFFVISGYLITSILIADLEAGQFSLARFYERRARRILPALFFVILCCLPFAAAWMVPSQLKDFSQALVATSLFASNILFWVKTDYFAPAAEENPLLHTWSLAVEEQFYIIFPILLWLLWRTGRGQVFWVIVTLCVISLGFSEWAWRNSPSTNFYMITSRAWELGAGALCAFILGKRPLDGPTPPLHHALAALGLGLILFSIFVYDSDTPFPSLYALAPVGGTVLIILCASPGTLVGRFLSLRACVGIGLISYSTYLWHQPLFAFARIRSTDHIEPALMLVLAAASLALGWFSWRYVERPFRHGGGALPRRTGVFVASVVGIVAMMGIGGAGHVSEGFFELKTTDTQAMILKTARNSPKRGFCHTYRTQTGRRSPEPCTYHDGPARWAVLGNSHGVELAYALADTLKPRNEAVMHFTISGCRPAFGLSQELGFCGTWADETVAEIAQNPEIEHVVLSYATSGASDAMITAYMNTAEALQAAGKTVIMALQTPRLPAHIEALTLRQPLEDAGQIRGHDRTTALAPTLALRTARAALSPEILVVDPFERFCDETTCYGVRDNKALYFDEHHMSLHGGSVIAEQILSAIE